MKTLFRKLLFLFTLIVSPIVFSQNTAINFDGVDDFIQTTYSGISGASARTCEAWIRTTANCNPSNGGTQNVILDYGTFSTGERFTFNVLFGNAIRVEIQGSGLNGTIAVNDGSWHHVACVFNPSSSNKYSLYVDGVLDVTGNISTPINTGSSVDLRIGKRIDNVKHFNGDIDEVRIYNYARTATQILADMNSEYCVNPSGLVAYYKMNEGVANAVNSSVTTIIDDSGNANNGTLNNFSVSGTTSNWVVGPVVTPVVPGSTINANDCSSYTTPSGNNTWTTSGTYFETLPSITGCDSVVTINLTIGLPMINMSGTTCDNYTSPSGNYVWNNTGVYYDTILNSVGCDTAVVFTLTVASSEETMLATVCDLYTTSDGNDSFSSTGIYSITYSNSYGCDSIVNYDITVLNSSTNEIDISSCGEYVSPSGNNVWNSNGTYVDVIPNINGCDSTITINLTVTNIDTTINSSNGTFSSNQNSASYQWYECGANLTLLVDEVNQDFTPVMNGTYAVEVTVGSCTDLSDCVTIDNVGIDDNLLGELIIFPNPTVGPINISIGEYLNIEFIKIIDAQGREVYSNSSFFGNSIVINTVLPDGIYFVQVNTTEGVIAKKVIITTNIK